MVENDKNRRSQKIWSFYYVFPTPAILMNENVFSLRLLQIKIHKQLRPIYSFVLENDTSRSIIESKNQDKIGANAYKLVR